MFYQTMCPFCRKAFRYIDELKQEHPEFKDVEIEKIEENEQPELAAKYDYYYVPTFYIDGEKVHEGGIFKPEMEALLRKVLE
jgi:glutaredoxin